MKVYIDELLKIIEKYPNEDFNIVYLDLPKVIASSQEVENAMRFNKNHYEILKQNNVESVEIVYTDKFIAKLIVNFPHHYRFPVGRKSVIDLDRIMENLEDMNRQTRHKRSLLSLIEIYKPNQSGINQLILKYNEILTVARWNDIKGKIPKTALIDYRFDECGIVIFHLSKTDNVVKHSFADELFELLMNHRKDFNIDISPDFIPEQDVKIVKNGTELNEIYFKLNPKLIIVTQELTEEHKLPLAMIKKNDKFARMMIIKSFEGLDKIKVLEAIKTKYNQMMVN